MIPYDLDPTLHTTQPHEPVLDDGFSRPDMDANTDDHVPGLQKAPSQPVLSDKSDF